MGTHLLEEENWTELHLVATVKQTYYKGISQDERIFELKDDMKRIRSHDETIAVFELGYFDITLGNLDDAAIVGDLMNVEILLAVVMQQLSVIWWMVEILLAVVMQRLSVIWWMVEILLAIMMQRLSVI